MNTSNLTFTANDQELVKNSGMDEYASNTVSYIKATFTLGTNWSGFDSVRAVWSSYYNVISTVLDTNNSCMVPAEMLLHKSKVQVNLVGSIVEGGVLTDRLTTFPVEALKVSADAKVSGSETVPVTPSQFEQFVDSVEAAAQSVTDYSYDSEAWAKGTRGGTAVSSSDPTYHNNSKYWNDQGAALSQEVTNLKSDFGYIVGRTNLFDQAEWTVGAYISESGVITAYSAAKYTSLIPISADAVVYHYRASNTSTTTRIHGYDSNGNWLKQITSFPTGTIITDKLATFYPTNCAYIRISESTTIKPLALVDGGSVTEELTTDEVRFEAVKDGVTFTNSGWSDLYLNKGEVVTINMDTLSSKVNVYMSTDTNHPLLINTVGTYRFTATESGWLSFYDFGASDFDMSATISLHSRYDVDIEQIRTAIAPPQEYVVDINGTGGYTSFSACLKALANNSNLKRITVLEGIYDIYSEIGGSAYVDSLTGTDWRSVNDIVPPNTIIQGVGDVYLNYLPETAAEVGKTLISPLNLSGSVEVHNINIHCKNCRYAIHLEGSALPAFDDAKIVLDNVNIVREQGLYARQVLGSGLNKGCVLSVKNCTWENTESQNFYVHTNSLIKHPRITVENCQFITHGTSSFYFSSENKVHNGEVLVRLNGVYANNANIVKADIQNGDCFRVIANGCNALTQSTFNTGYPMNDLDQYLTIS